jgi:diaminopimelate decarboxylase
MSNPIQDLSNQQLCSIASQFGTPLYLYNTDRIALQYAQLQQAFSGTRTRIFYASKALTNINILKFLRQLGSSVDCVSINEVKLALKAGFTPDRVLFTPNCTDIDEYIAAKDLGVIINIDSLPMLEKFGTLFGSGYPVNLRLNPHIMAGGNLKISTGHVNSKFGISIQQIDEILAIVQQHRIPVEGIHLHTGSEIKEVSVFMKGLDLMLEIAHRFPSLKAIDLGGGFKVPYKPGDHETDILALGKAVADAFQRYKQETGQSLEVWFEPGKYLVSQCGYLLVKANVVKKTPATTFVGVNSGFNHLIRPMFYEAYHHIVNCSNPNGNEQTYTVVGNICETDTFAWDRPLPEVREGDILAFLNAGAYSFEMSSNFNSRLKPAEVMVINGEAKLIRRRETFDDLLEGQVEVL